MQFAAPAGSLLNTASSAVAGSLPHPEPPPGHPPVNLTRKLLLSLPACNDCSPFKQRSIDVNEAQVAEHAARPGTSLVILGAGETTKAADLQLDLRLLGPAYSAADQQLCCRSLRADR